MATGFDDTFPEGTFTLDLPGVRFDRVDRLVQDIRAERRCGLRAGGLSSKVALSTERWEIRT
jgi:hypothetical protein